MKFQLNCVNNFAEQCAHRVHKFGNFKYFLVIAHTNPLHFRTPNSLYLPITLFLYFINLPYFCDLSCSMKMRVKMQIKLSEKFEFNKNTLKCHYYPLIYWCQQNVIYTIYIKTKMIYLPQALFFSTERLCVLLI